MESVFVIGQVAIDDRLFKGHKSVDVFKVGCAAVVVGAHLAHKRERRVECEPAGHVH